MTMKGRSPEMESLDPKVYEALTENSQRIHYSLDRPRDKSSVPKLLVYKEIQAIWNKSKDDLIAA